MTFSFLHAGIALLGVAAAAIPIILHLLLKAKPKPLVFPALQLIKKKQMSTTRRLRLQHLLLLAMRIGLLLFLALALARPTLHSPLFSIDQEAPVAAALIIDDSLSMQYKHKGKTRLDEAKEAAARVVQQMPDGSKLFVLQASNPVQAVAADIPTGLAQVRSMEPQAVAQTLDSSVAAALESLTKAELQRREVYLFTDMSANAWNFNAADRLEKLAQQVETGVRIYVINLGVDARENLSVGELQLSHQLLPANTDLRITASVQNTGPAVDKTVELVVDGQPRDSKPVRLPANDTAQIVFTVPALEQGTHQGSVAVASGDPMPFDDIRYFSVEVRPAIRTLLVADDPDDVVHWMTALAPDEELRRQGRGQYQIEVVLSEQLGQTDLASFAAVSLINAGKVDQNGWLKLAPFVQGGGGLFVALGERIDPVSYGSAPAQSVLPGRLAEEVKNDNGVTLELDQLSHPALASLGQWQSETQSELANRPFFRYWKLQADNQRALPLLKFSDGSPGLVERTFLAGERGRCVLFTSAMHYRPSADAWSEFPLSWAYLYLADHLTRYLAGVADAKLNYFAGQNVQIPFDGSRQSTLFAVTDPDQKVERFTVDIRETALSIPSVKQLGHFQVAASDADKAGLKGFSVNVPGDESTTAVATAEQLEQLFGKERTSIAKDPESLEEVVGAARVGRELFSWIMLLVLLLLGVESYFANRFYKRPPQGEPI